jgi:hypothetical protein
MRDGVKLNEHPIHLALTRRLRSSRFSPEASTDRYAAYTERHDSDGADARLHRPR